MPTWRNADKASMLGTIPLFQSLSKRDIAHVCRIADDLDCQPGKVLMREGTTGRELILIVEGSVRIERGGKTIAHRGAGDFLGELALLDGRPRTATVVAEAPCQLLVIHGRQFWPLLEAAPSVQRKMLIGLVGRLRDALDPVV